MATSNAKGEETEAAHVDHQRPAANESASHGISGVANSAKTKSASIQDKAPAKSKCGESDAQNAPAGQVPSYSTAKTNTDVSPKYILSSICTENGDHIVGNGVARCKGKV
jgi:hypothetical protein